MSESQQCRCDEGGAIDPQRYVTLGDGGDVPIRIATPVDAASFLRFASEIRHDILSVLRRRKPHSDEEAAPDA